VVRSNTLLENNMHRRKWQRFALLVGGVLLLDQLSKNWILANVALYESLPILPPWVFITHSYNTGAAFGMGDGASDFFLVLAALIVAGLLWVYSRATPTDWLPQIGYSLIIGGASGNIVDRLQHGHVIDFVHLVLPNVISNVSNFADHAIVLGVGVLVVDSLRPSRPATAAQPLTVTPDPSPPEA
jgi:signal peptidase II